MTLQTRRVLALAVIGLAVFAVMCGAIWYFMWRPTRYVDAEHRFSIRYSPEWEYTGPGEGASTRAHRTLHDSEGTFSAAISVWANPIENLPDAQTFRAWYIKNFISKFSGYTRLEEGIRATPIGLTPWMMFLHRTEAGDRVQVWQFYFVKNTTGYVISCAATPSAFEKFRREFAEAVDSFQLE